MTCDPIPAYGPPDVRAIHRTAVSRVGDALRHGRIREALRWNRVMKRTGRRLRIAARIRAGRLRIWVFDDSRCIDHPHCSHPLFSEAAEKSRDPIIPAPDRRRTFREGRLRW